MKIIILQVLVLLARAAHAQNLPACLPGQTSNCSSRIVTHGNFSPGSAVLREDEHVWYVGVEALLPPPNATGNFVKVVQRLPVRIDILNYDPDRLPLFVGLSVTPSVNLHSKPTGPNAGKFLQDLMTPAIAETASATPAK